MSGAPETLVENVSIEAESEVSTLPLASEEPSPGACAAAVEVVEGSLAEVWAEGATEVDVGSATISSSLLDCCWCWPDISVEIYRRCLR